MRLDPTRTADRWRFSVEPHYSRFMEARQFLTAFEGGRAETFGRRYVFSFVERSELSAQFRVNYAFTPDLGLELYAEPFASSGRYDGFGELGRAGGRHLCSYGTDGSTLARDEDGDLLVTDGADAFTLENPDFNVRSLRSNLLLRWEWQPGSTLNLVWQQNPESFADQGSFVTLGSLADALTASGENVLALKITYCFRLAELDPLI